jgi:hypothetical protein
MASLTWWLRLDSTSRAPDTAETLADRVRDPLWMLARQWQLAELRGHDAGSPVQATVRHESAPLSRFCAGGPPYAAAKAERFDPAAMPLDAMIEREPVRAGSAAPHHAAEAGLQLLRVLDANGLSAYRAAVLAAFPLPALGSSAILAGDDGDLLGAAIGRVPDGAAAFKALSAADPTSGLQIAAADKAKLLRAARQYTAWYRGLFSEPDAGQPSWSDDRLEYRFAVAARFPDREVVLAAPEHDGGRIGWEDLDAAEGVSLGTPAAVTTGVQSPMPAPVRFRGMPPSRCWEMEDAGQDLTTVSAAPTDLARLLVLDFALIYGSDWFLVPLRVPVGSITRVASLVVTDTFGERVLVPPVHRAAHASLPWSAFQPGGDPDLLLFPPTPAQGLRGADLEDVLFLRDEGADVAWAVEDVVEGAAARPIRRGGPDTELPLRAPPEASRYRLANGVPGHWIPLIPVDAGGSRQLLRGTVLPADHDPLATTLTRGTQLVAKQDVNLRAGPSTADAVLHVVRGGEMVTVVSPDPAGNFLEVQHGATVGWSSGKFYVIADATRALGRVLVPERTFALPDEEVPREGTRVRRAFRLARWIDGSTRLWLSRTRSTGRGEGASHLEYDLIG